MAKSKKHQRISGSEVKTYLAQAKGAVPWRALVAEMGAETPRDITNLRKLLKGMERNDELKRDMSGAYYLPNDDSASAVGIVEQRGKDLLVDGVLIDTGPRSTLRAGDRVEYVVSGDAARVREVLSYSDTPVLGTLKWQGRYPYVEALGAVRGRISLVEMPDAAHGDTVAVKILTRERRGLAGVVTSVVEAGSVVEEAIRTAIASFEIPNEWPEDVVSQCKRLPKSVQKGRFPNRLDLTDMPLITIDGETAKDFDDAVYAESRRGGWRLVVAIADVAHYVKTGSALDAEARERGTSVYLPDFVVPMLPEQLSNGLCSLRPEEARLSLVCDMQVSRKGVVKQFEFHEAVIYSHARLTYTQVEGFLNTGELPEVSGKVLKSLKQLKNVYQALRSQREGRGALDFESHESAITLENGRIGKIGPVERLVAHQLIEEAMVAANVCAAMFLEFQETPSLYRVHQAPDPAKLEELRSMLAHVGVRLSKNDVSPASLQAAMSKLPKGENNWLYSQMALRTMQQAVYTPDNDGHFGLALERYMHFTSPIRRYPDLLVHRAIKACLGSGRGRVETLDALHWLGEQCSTTERRAESAGWMVDGWLKCDYLLDRIGDTFDGLIATVTEFGAFVELEGYFVQGLLHVSNLGSDYYHYNPSSASLIGERSGRGFRLGDRVKVVIVDIEPAQGKVDLRLAEDKQAKTKRGEKSRRKKKDREERPTSRSDRRGRRRR